MSVRIPVSLKSQIALIQKNTNVRTLNRMVVELLDEAITARMTDKVNGENPLLTEIKVMIQTESEFIVNNIRPDIQRLDWMVAKMAKYVYVTRYLLQDFEGLFLELHGKKGANEYAGKMADKLWDRARMFFQKETDD